MSEANKDAGSPRHILGLSGGKDSSALAVFMRDKVPEMEYVFCDTEKELQETYDYLAKLEAFLNKPIKRLKHEQGIGFDDLLKMRNGFLPSPQMRWCTDYLKIKPFEKYVGNAPVINYVGIRADEQHRKGYISHKPNIISRFPFIESNIRQADVSRILEDAGLGLPSYYEWRSRSGCFFCFFQQRREWVGLLETHPDLFRQAMEYERTDPKTGERYTWVQGESLEELAKPERIAQIKEEYERRLARNRSVAPNSPLLTVLGNDVGPDETTGCLICHL
jgi:3'-phosphoadenosine 5'-phosphosulfate sulfotransferase (PAPS reductase)/FAD synthetase